MRILIISILFLPVVSFAQKELRGVVQNKQGYALFAANAYLASAPQKGVFTNFKGQFNLETNNEKDTLIISFIGFKTRKISIESMSLDEPLIITLKENTQSLEEIIIKAQDLISEQFSVEKMDKFDIYSNPMAQGDPLKAVTSLPASTITNETANPALRGSTADRSRVVLNDIPIYNPVRANQLNRQGFFSLFNPDIIDKQYVYASNPPLTHGNASAGMVKISTNKHLETNTLQLSTTLASFGLFLSREISDADDSFLQVYCNNQFSDAFVGIQKDNLPNIKKFNARDMGLNFHSRLGKKSDVNSFHYVIDEQFSGITELHTYKGDVNSAYRRYFTVNNLKYYTRKSVLSINTGTDFSNKKFDFGNLKSENRARQMYSSLDCKWLGMNHIDVQFGISFDYLQTSFSDSIPVYYYDLRPTSPSFKSNIAVSHQNLEAYLYTNWNVNNRWTLSSGIRSNVPPDNQKHFLSSQLALKFKLNEKHSFLFSCGKYHNYSFPTFYSQKFDLLASLQIALDYSFEMKNMMIKAAAYHKSETGEQVTNSFLTVENINIFGIELFLKKRFYKYFECSFSNTFLDQSFHMNHRKYRGHKDLNYLIKMTLHYNNPKLFSMAATYIGRPGTYYTPIVGSIFNCNQGSFEPELGSELNSSQYGNYNRIDLNLSRYFKFKNNFIITFVSLSNVLNYKNQKKVCYNANYSNHHFDHYQFRTIYFGLVWQLRH